MSRSMGGTSDYAIFVSHQQRQRSVHYSHLRTAAEDELRSALNEAVFHHEKEEVILALLAALDAQLEADAEFERKYPEQAKAAYYAKVRALIANRSQFTTQKHKD